MPNKHISSRHLLLKGEGTLIKSAERFPFVTILSPSPFKFLQLSFPLLPWSSDLWTGEIMENRSRGCQSCWHIAKNNIFPTQIQSFPHGFSIIVAFYSEALFTSPLSSLRYKNIRETFSISPPFGYILRDAEDFSLNHLIPRSDIIKKALC